MDRRTFMTAGAWCPVAAAGVSGVWPWLAQAAVEPGTIAVVDTTLARGAEFARHLARMNVPVLDTGDDIGTLWYATLAPRLAQTPASLIGLTRASDYFVLRQLATRGGLMIEHSRERSVDAAFVLTPRRVR
ncbi:hypothetical protein PQQ51_25090 [Paraburkholderia xenovorans]|uniref:hypothetical protein n=1 Tax=Paraburkholderia xenovorans TaxID=36873 RepID=UPI0038B85D84